MSLVCDFCLLGSVVRLFRGVEFAISLCFWGVMYFGFTFCWFVRVVFSGGLLILEFCSLLIC